MLTSPEVMQAWGGPLTPSQVKYWLDNQFDRYRLWGFGEMAVIEKTTGQFIGQAGLILQRFAGCLELEIAYMLKRPFWGQGYASEAAAACRQYAFERLGAGRVCCSIRYDNLRSIAVAKRLGMKYEKGGTQTLNGREVPHLLYVQARPEVLVREYDAEWPSLFIQLEQFMAPLLEQFGLRLFHVGGTAVPGMASQPVIDAALAPMTPTAILPRPMLDTALGNLGFFQDEDDSRVFDKTSKLRFLHRLILCESLADAEKMIAERDELIHAPEATRSRSLKKIQLAGQYPEDIDKYNTEKNK